MATNLISSTKPVVWAIRRSGLAYTHIESKSKVNSPTDQSHLERTLFFTRPRFCLRRGLCGVSLNFDRPIQASEGSAGTPGR